MPVDLSSLRLFADEPKNVLNKREEDPLMEEFDLGEKAIDHIDEWSGADFGLDIGERLKFPHKPIEMERKDKVLYEKNQKHE